MRISGASPLKAAMAAALCMALAACDGPSYSRQTPGLAEDQKLYDNTISDLDVTPEGVNAAANAAAAGNAAVAAPRPAAHAAPVAVHDCSANPDDCRIVVPGLGPWMSAALVLGGFAAGMLVTMLAFLWLRRKPEVEGEDSPAVRRHYELMDMIGKLQYRNISGASGTARAASARPALDRVPAGWTPPGQPQPAPPPTPAIDPRQLGDVAARFNAVAALPEPVLDDYLSTLHESRMYDARVNSEGQLELGPGSYNGAADVDLVAIALSDDAAALIPSLACLDRFRAGGMGEADAGREIAAMFGLVADGSRRLKCSRPAVIEHNGQELRIVPGQLSGFVPG